MESALARQPRISPASLRVRWITRAGFCLTGAAVAGSLAWFAPLRGIHLFPTRTRSAPAVASVPSAAPTQTHDPARILNGIDTKAAVTVPSSPTVEPASGDKAVAAEPANGGDQVTNATIVARALPSDSGKTQDGNLSSAIAAEPSRRSIVARDALPIPEPAPRTTPRPQTATPLIPPAVNPAPGAVSSVPEPRPPLPLETDLIATGSPDANTAAQSGTTQPATTTTPGKPSPADRHG